MNTKIIGLVICMLLIITSVPPVVSLHESQTSTMISNSGVQSCARVDWSQQQKLLASDGAEGDGFGWSVSLSGTTLLMGSPLDDDNGAASGSAYVFTRSGSTWVQQQKILAPDGATNDNFGYSVSISGGTALIGAWADDDLGSSSGSAYVFTRTGITWTLQQKLLASDGASDDNFGTAVALFGDTALIGALGDDYMKGSAYVFTRSGTTWTQQQKLIASDGAGDDGFGSAVALHNNTVLIGALGDNNYKGSAYVFTRSGTTWTQQAKLIASDGAIQDFFGASVALEADTALIGTPGYLYNPVTGSAYVFTRAGTTWTQQAKLLASDGAAGDQFGCAVGLSGDTAFIGACYDSDYGMATGSVYVFGRTGSSWAEQQKLLASDAAAGDIFGNAVAVDRNIALIGDYFDSISGVYVGSAYVFTKGEISDLQLSVKGGLGVSIVIKNNGTTSINGVDWQIHVEGGIFKSITKTVNGTVDIAAGKSKRVTTGLFFGLGPVAITAKVVDMEKKATGTILLFFVLGVK
jgi:hypothetical protein